MNERSMRQVASLSKMAAAAATVLALSAGAARADTLQATDDAYVTLGNGTNFGGSQDLLVQNMRGQNQTLLRFDLSVLPAGAQLDKASLRLWVDAIGQAGTVDLYIVLDPWNEDVVSGDLMPLADAVPFASLPIAPADADGFVTIDVTDQVQDWHENFVANNGILLVPNLGGVDVTFDSTEDQRTSHQPELEVIAVAAPTSFVPPGAVMAFDLSACPPGWGEYTVARGRYLVGGSTPGAAVGSALTANENRAVGAHNHAVDPPGTHTQETGAHQHFYNEYLRAITRDNTYSILDAVTYRVSPSTILNRRFTESEGDHWHNLDILPFSSGMAGSVGGTNAPYVQLLMCRKN